MAWNPHGKGSELLLLFPPVHGKIGGQESFYTRPSVSHQMPHFQHRSSLTWEMMKNVRLTNANPAEFMALRDEHLGNMCKMHGLCSGEFSHMAEFVCVSICFHFQVPKVVSDMDNHLLEKEEWVIATYPKPTSHLGLKN